MTTTTTATPDRDRSVAARIEALLASEREAATRVSTVNTFLPGRVAYAYEIEGDFTPALPTTIWRARDEYSRIAYSKAGQDAQLVERISSIIAYGRGGGGGAGGESQRHHRKVRKKVRKGDGLSREHGGVQRVAALPIAAAAVAGGKRDDDVEDDDDDIFADAGSDYVVKRRPPTAPHVPGAPATTASATRAVSHAKGSSYFASPSGASIVLKGAGVATDGKDLVADLLEDDARGAVDGAGKAHALMEADEEDAYGELFPQNVPMLAVDGDADEPSRREATGKDDGGKGEAPRQATNKSKAKAAKRKEESRFEKIRGIFEEKGFGNEGAFSGQDHEGEASEGKAAKQKRRKLKL